jgi:hypothetical protein
VWAIFGNDGRVVADGGLRVTPACASFPFPIGAPMFALRPTFVRRPGCLAAVPFRLLGLAAIGAASTACVVAEDARLPVGVSPEIASPPVAVDAGGASVLSPPPPPPSGCAKGAKGAHPADDACWINAAFGVFVSKRFGSGVATGAQDAPFASIGGALAALRASPNSVRTRVFVCAEEYAEGTVELVDGISVYGYFDCTKNDMQGRWQVDTAAHAKVKATATIALRAKRLVNGSRVESMEFVAADAITAGASSYGLEAVQSKGLLFVRTRIVAGRGGDGADGAAPVQLVSDRTADGTAGTAPSACQWVVIGPGVPNLFVCDVVQASTGGTNACGGVGVPAGPGGGGGKGARVVWREIPAGSPRFVATTPETRTEGQPLVATTTTAQGAVYNSALAVAGSAGGAGASGPNGAGTWSMDGYVAGDGQAGLSGLPGQGGGGGAGGGFISPFLAGGFALGDVWSNGRGSGGGAGGCPGLAGGRGTGGGASVGVYASASVIRFEGGEIATSIAGRAGKGSAGSVATAGGVAGANLGTSDNSRGAAGGRGGFAGASGHGAAGPAYNVVSTGDAPVLAGTSLPLAAAAAGQPASVNTDGVSLPSANAGAVATSYSF